MNENLNTLDDSVKQMDDPIKQMEDSVKQMSITPKIEKTKTTKTIRKTLYWCVEFPCSQMSKILNNIEIADSLEKNPQLVALKNMHTTLLYLGKKDSENEKQYFDFINHECMVEIDSYAISEQALCLNVSELRFKSTNNNVPSFAKHQHVTVALKNLVKAADSIKSFDDGVKIVLKDKLILSGFIKRN